MSLWVLGFWYHFTMRRKFTIVFCYILLGGLASPGTVVAGDPFVAKVNEARAANGMVQVQESASLQGSSRNYARWMVPQQLFWSP